MHYCRLCLLNLEQKEDGVPLFENNEESKLSKLIAKILQIELTQTDDVSTIICSDCWQHLDDIQNFCIYIEEKQKSFNTDLYEEKICDYVDEHVEVEVGLERDEEEVEDVDKEELDQTEEEITITPIDFNDGSLLEEEEEDETSSSEMEMVEHDIKEESNCTDEDEDEVNELRRSSRKANKKHTTTAAKRKKAATLGEVTTKQPKPKSKPTLSKEEDSRRRDEFVTKHMQLKCEICGTNAKTFFSLMTHFRVDHYCNGYVKCCNKHYTTRGALVDHINYHVDPTQFHCKICDRYYKSKYFLNTHKSVIHPKTEQVKYECKICDKGFVRKHDFNKHNMRHQGEKQYHCQICRKKYLHKSSRDEHIRFVHGDANFVCNYCGQDYKSRENFKRHVAEHEGIVEPPVQCPTCGDWSKNRFCLRKHMDTHNRIDAACTFCGRICATKRALLTHVRMYHTSKPEILHCSFCNKGFTRKRSLVNHVAIHTGEKHHKCRYCTREFRSCSNMNSHIKKDHFEEWMQAKMDRKENLQKLAESLAETSNASSHTETGKP